mgnify:CR=1 FL=1
MRALRLQHTCVMVLEDDIFGGWEVAAEDGTTYCCRLAGTPELAGPLTGCAVTLCGGSVVLTDGIILGTSPDSDCYARYARALPAPSRT